MKTFTRHEVADYLKTFGIRHEFKATPVDPTGTLFIFGRSFDTRPTFTIADDSTTDDQLNNIIDVMTKPEKPAPRTVDITPTWRGMLPLLIETANVGTAKGRSLAMNELYRMADLADSVTKKG